MKNWTAVGSLITLVMLIGIIIGIVILAPLAFIWAINTLFGLKIMMTFWNWLAALILLSFFKVNASKTK